MQDLKLLTDEPHVHKWRHTLRQGCKDKQEEIINWYQNEDRRLKAAP